VTLVRVNTSDLVAERIVEMIFAGELRAGDRIDLDAIGEHLGVSRAPVREALLALRRDGIVDMPYHRGAFVGAFDAGTVREAFELYALLNALTTARVARRRAPAVLEELDDAAARTRAASGAVEFEVAAREFRRLINIAAGGPHLRALVRTFGGLVPVASRLAIEGRLDEERAAVEETRAAIAAGDPERASAATIAHIRRLGERAVATLRERGVIDADDEGATDPDLELLLAALDRRGDA
jgi:DNA-binding GntR family transcriptional regulator